MQPKLNKESSISFWDYFMVLIMIFVSGKTLIFSTNIDPKYVLVYNIFPILYFPFLYIYTYRKRNNHGNDGVKRLRVFFITFCALIVVSAIGNFDVRGGYFVTILFFITSFIYVKTVPLNTFITIFEKIVWWITIISVPIFILCFIFPDIRYIFPTITNAGFNIYANLFITVIPLWDRESSYFRMYGPFSEPGMYQIYLNLSLLFHIYLNGHLQLKKAIVYIVAILLTLSTTGYICLAIILMSYMFGLSRRKNKLKNYAISLLIIIAFGIIYAQTTLFSAESDVFRKISGESMSAISREASITVNAEIFYNNPLFGVGFSDMNDSFKSICKRKYGVTGGVSNTNTLLYPFAALGFFFGILWLYAIFLFCRRFGNNLISKVFVVLAVLLMLSGELIFGCFWMYALLGYGILEKKVSATNK